MTASNDLERRLADWLEGQAPTREPAGLIDAVTTRVAQTSRLPGWAIPGRWIPAPFTSRLAVVPRALIMLLALALLTSLALGGALVAGALTRESPSPLSGPARNGLIAYSDGRDIWLVDERGEQRQQLTSARGWDVVGAWSPDGTWLAYWAIHSNDFSGRDISLRVIRPGDSEPRVLVSDLRWPDSDRACGTHLSWSPDGTAIAYAHLEKGADGGAVRIEIVPLDEDPSRTLVQGRTRGEHLGRSPSWSPDGRTIAYQSWDDRIDTGGDAWSRGRLFAVPVAGGTSEPLGFASSRGGPGDCGFHDGQWSPDGSLIASQLRTETGYQVVVTRADGTDEITLTPDGGYEWWPRWSPDGTRLAVSRYLDSSYSVPVIMAPDGSEQVVLDVQHPSWNSQVLWSPDGTSLLVAGELEGLAILDPTGTEPPVLIPSATGEWVWHFAWQPLLP